MNLLQKPMSLGQRNADLSEINFRSMEIQAGTINTEKREVSVVMSTESKVRINHKRLGPITEILDHSPSSVDLTRAVRGLPIIREHNLKGDIYGRVNNVHLDGNRHLVGTAKFAEGPTWDLVKDEILTDVSIGYLTDDDKYEVQADGSYLSRSWMPCELSMTNMGLDINTGVNRHVGVMDGVRNTPELDAEALRLEGQRAEFERMDGIRQLCDLSGSPGLADQYIRDPKQTLDSVRAALLAHKANAGGEGDNTFSQRSGVQGGADEVDRNLEGMSNALMQRSALVSERSPEFKQLQERNAGNQFRGMSLLDMARYTLGQRSLTMSSDQIMDAVMQGRAVDQAIPSTGLIAHFPSLLADQINKALLNGWTEHEETWPAWVQTGNASDFKAGSRVHLSNFSNLDVVAENTDYTEGKVEDEAEPFQLQTFGKLWSISRQSLINDDLSGLGRVPQSMGRAARRTVGNSVYAILTANGNMADGNPLFDLATHANEAAAAAISETTLDAGRVAMGIQTDNNGVTLGIVPRFLLVPLGLESVAHKVVNSEFDTTGSGFAINPVRRTMQNLQIVSEHRLQADSATKWYLAGGMDTVEVVYLNGVQEPALESEPNWKRDGLHYKVRLDFDVLATDYRSLYGNGT